MVTKKLGTTKPIQIGIALFVLVLIGIAVFAQMRMREDEEKATRSLLAKGNYLVSLISLNPTQNFLGSKRDFFLRTLTEYAGYEGLAYFFVHDDAGDPIVSLAPSNLAYKIPKDVERISLNAMGLKKQSFTAKGSGNMIYEFSKPIFEEGRKTGTVRLGLKPSTLSIFSWQRIKPLVMIALFMFAIILVLYYGITLLLRPLKDLNADLRSACTNSATVAPATATSDGIGTITSGLERSLQQIKQRLGKIEADNVALASKLGVVTFEKNQINNILDSIKFGIVITDVQDNISYINDFMLRLFKKDHRAVMGRPFHEIITHEKIVSFVSQEGVGKQATSNGQMETKIPELAPGETFRIKRSYLQDGDGTLIGKMISVQNVTSEKQAEITKHEFISHVAHELKTPLTTIKSYNEMLMEGEIEDKETQIEFYNTINEETDRLTRLIQDLLDMSKIELGALKLNKGLVKTDWLVGDCIAAVEAPAQKKRLTIEKNLPDNFPALVGDKELLKVAIINLLNNAVKYTPEAGKISFALAEQDSKVIFDVIDTGYGISKEDLPHIFKRSYRSQEAHVAEQSGTGLGLAITSEIIRLHGGQIQVKSELGKGSYFRIHLPKEEFYLEGK